MTYTPPATFNPPSHQAQDGHARPLSALAVSALVLSIIALVVSWVPIVNNLAFLIAAIGLILGIIAIVKTSAKGRKRGRGLAIAGTVLSVLSLVAVIATQGIYGNAIDKATGGNASTSQSAPKAKVKNTAKPAATLGEGDIDNGQYHIKLVSVVKGPNDYEGKPTVALTYELTNAKDSDSNIFDVHVQAFQNKVGLDTATYLDQTPQGYDPQAEMKTIQPHGSITIVAGYVLNDPTTPIDVVAAGTMDASGQKVSQTYSLQ
jgi:hypothetical protein